MTAIAPATTDALPGARLGRTRSRQSLRTVVITYPVAAAASIYLLALVVSVTAASFVAPDAPEQQDLTHVLAGPSGAHWLGTDRLGRDVLSRLLFGAQVTLLDVAVATMVFLALGVPLGVVAGYLGRWLDRVVGRFADLVLAMPAIVILLMVVAIFPGNDIATMIALGVIGCPGLLRIVRSATIAIRGELCVKAAQLSGLATPAILHRHVLPRVAGPIIVQTSLFCATALLAESGLSFLGLTRPETRGPSWGNMVGEASTVMSENPWLLVPTGGALILTVMAFGLIGDAVRDATMEKSGPTASFLPHRPRLRRAEEPTLPPPATDAPALSVRRLTVTLAGKTVIRDVTFDVAPGEAVGIVGESGCGKTITARAILGLLPGGAVITDGSVVFDRGDLTMLSEKNLNRVRGAGIAFISQNPVGGLDPTFTIGNQLREIVRRHHPHSRRQARIEAERLLRLVRLPDPASVLRCRPDQLSGGMAQRVSIAMALAAKPKLLVADEPTTALDVTVQAEILALLRDLRHRLGMALLLITHDWGVLADQCERAVVMYAGEVVETATVDQLYARPRHPYTAALLAANPHVARTGQALPSIPGTVPRPGEWPEGCHFQARCPLAEPACGLGPITLTSVTPRHTSRCIRTEEL